VYSYDLNPKGQEKASKAFSGKIAFISCFKFIIARLPDYNIERVSPLKD
jgi:hypothetical protein